MPRAPCCQNRNVDIFRSGMKKLLVVYLKRKKKKQIRNINQVEFDLCKTMEQKYCTQNNHVINIITSEYGQNFLLFPYKT